MRKMSEQEAWLWIAAQIQGAPDTLVLQCGTHISGLCYIVHRFRENDTISFRTFKKMESRIKAGLRTLGRNEYYLHTPERWYDGVRLNWCLKFADQAARKK